MIRVLIAGEGANEIGHWARHAPDEERTTGVGVIEALLTKVRSGGWEVRAALQWKDIHKLRPSAAGDREERAVHILVMRARELGCNALIFLRDRDGPRNLSRERAIQRAVREAEKRPELAIASGVPVEMLESWLLALRGDPKSEDEQDPVLELHRRHKVAPKRTTAMIELVRHSRLLDAPDDAASFWRWIRRAATALNVSPIPKQWPRP